MSHMNLSKSTTQQDKCISVKWKKAPQQICQATPLLAICQLLVNRPFTDSQVYGGAVL